MTYIVNIVNAKQGLLNVIKKYLNLTKGPRKYRIAVYGSLHVRYY